MIVVIGSYGEYEQRSETLYGVFESLEDAERAVADAVHRAPEQTKLWYEWDSRRSDALKSFKPERIIDLGARGPCECYSLQHHRESEQIAGARPGVFHCDTICYYELQKSEFKFEGWAPIKEVELAAR